MFVDEQTLLSRLTPVGLAVIATIVWVSFDAGTASASCGDYVMVGGHDHDSGNHSMPDHAMPGVPSCHGPNCHQQAPLPVLPTKGLLNAPPTEVACWEAGDSSGEHSFSSATFERRFFLAEGHSLPLLRPPCL